MCCVSTSRFQEGTNKCKSLHVNVPIYELSIELTARRPREALLRKVAELEAQLKAQRSEDTESTNHDFEFSPSSAAVTRHSQRGQSGTSITEGDPISVDALASGAFDEAPASDIGFFGMPSNAILLPSKS